MAHKLPVMVRLALLASVLAISSCRSAEPKAPTKAPKKAPNQELAEQEPEIPNILAVVEVAQVGQTLDNLIEVAQYGSKDIASKLLFGKTAISMMGIPKDSRALVVFSDSNDGVVVVKSSRPKELAQTIGEKYAYAELGDYVAIGTKDLLAAFKPALESALAQTAPVNPTVQIYKPGVELLSQLVAMQVPDTSDVQVMQQLLIRGLKDTELLKIEIDMSGDNLSAAFELKVSPASTLAKLFADQKPLATGFANMTVPTSPRALFAMKLHDMNYPRLLKALQQSWKAKQGGDLSLEMARQMIESRMIGAVGDSVDAMKVLYQLPAAQAFMDEKLWFGQAMPGFEAVGKIRRTKVANAPALIRYYKLSEPDKTKPNKVTSVVAQKGDSLIFATSKKAAQDQIRAISKKPKTERSFLRLKKEMTQHKAAIGLLFSLKPFTDMPEKPTKARKDAYNNLAKEFVYFGVAFTKDAASIRVNVKKSVLPDMEAYHGALLGADATVESP